MYYIGLRKAGSRLVVEAASSVDQLSCETWKYFGQRDVTLGYLKSSQTELLDAVNKEYGQAFERVSIVKIADDDFIAGHKDVRE